MADAPLVEIAHDPVTRGQSEGASTGKHNGVNFLNGRYRIQKIGLDRAGRPPAHVHARDRAVAREDHSAAGGPLVQRVMPDRYAFDSREAASAALPRPIGSQAHRADSTMSSSSRDGVRRARNASAGRQSTPFRTNRCSPR